MPVEHFLKAHPPSALVHVEMANHRRLRRAMIRENRVDASDRQIFVAKLPKAMLAHFEKCRRDGGLSMRNEMSLEAHLRHRVDCRGDEMPLERAPLHAAPPNNRIE